MAKVVFFLEACHTNYKNNYTFCTFKSTSSSFKSQPMFLYVTYNSAEILVVEMEFYDLIGDFKRFSLREIKSDILQKILDFLFIYFFDSC